jgi:sigma-B regulation protein RsbU (phosphoserine phosphatase)
MNSSVFEAGRRGEVTMTCFVSIIDPATRAVSFANAGHPQPLLIRRSPQGLTPRVLHCMGDPLGLDESTLYIEHCVKLHKNDLMLWYTDGVTECRNRQGKRLSERRLLKFFAGASEPYAPDLLRDHLVTTIGRFHQDAPPDDDVTFVIGRIG